MNPAPTTLPRARRISRIRPTLLASWILGWCLAPPAGAAPQRPDGADREQQDAPTAGARSLRVPLASQPAGGVQDSWPGIGCWFWTARELAPGGYRAFLDRAGRLSDFGLLTTSIRAPVEVTDPAVHDQILLAARYARDRGMGLVMDLDVRLARGAFMARHPDELQEIVRLRTIDLTDSGSVELRVETRGGGDHYTFRAPAYDPVASRLLRVYVQGRDADGRRTGPVEDRTDRCLTLQADARALAVRIPCGAEDRGKVACVLAAHSLFTPDVFAPHLIGFERGILRQYADVPLAGACKDEWGFPGGMADPANLWYSRFMAAAYARRRPSHELERDLLLMSLGEKARDGERAAAVNHYMAMLRHRNAEVEAAYRDSIREVFGPQAVSATHPTWFPYPDAREAFKNGLDWWAVPRELAQTDESTPFCVRTALAKRWRSPLWYNMYYDASLKSYEEDLWRHALGGGRMNFHPLYPGPWEPDPWSLADSRVLQAATRIGLLNFITTAPIDCPVAVVFGHPAALNWAADGFARVGLEITDALWQEGFYADLIPTSEIATGNLTLAPDGSVRYGPQSYAAAVLFQPQFEEPAVATFFRKASETGQTALYRVGDWTLDFEGRPWNGTEALPPGMPPAAAAETARQIIRRLTEKGVEPQTRGTLRGIGGFPASMMPGPAGRCRFLDGTVLLASGQKDVLGDPIRTSLEVAGQVVRFDAVGVAAVRFDRGGKVEALAAGGLKSLTAGELAIDLPSPADLALWRTDRGAWRGVLLGGGDPLPGALTRITTNWTRLRWPESRRR